MSAPEDPDMLAAEYVLALLDGPDLAEAERRVETDPAFAERVNWWQEQLAPLFDGIGELTPGPALWARINEALDGARRASNVHPLEARLRFWRGYASAATAIAAALLLGLATTWRDQRPLPAPVPIPSPAPVPAPAPAPLLVATVAAEDESSAFVVTLDQGRRELLVSPAVADAAPGRDFQLWLLGPDGTPRALGVIGGERAARIPLTSEQSAALADGVTLAVSVEPTGGSPTGLPTGPVIATGPLRSV